MAAGAMPSTTDPSVPKLRLASAEGRLTVAAAVLGSGAVFLESTVVNVALPALGRDLGLGMTGLQWVLNAYLLTLSGLMLFGGSLGDRLGRRRVFRAGALTFAATSVLCALAPGEVALVGARTLQGAAGALLVPNSLAMLDTFFAEEDRGAAIGQWAGWSAVSIALGPMAGGWLVDALSWRWVFGAVVVVALAAAGVVPGHVPDTRAMKRASDPGEGAAPARLRGGRALDYGGAILVTLGLAGLTMALVLGGDRGLRSPAVVGAGVGGAVLLAAFVIFERRVRDPLLPLALFRSRQFSGANLTTLLVYTGLSAVLFLLAIQLQTVLGYSALEAGAALLPVNLLMLLLSAPAGRLAQRIGPRLPMTVGPLAAAVGIALLTRAQPGATYLRAILPALVVFGAGLAVMVAPLTAAVLAAAPEDEAGVASAVNNAVARLAGLLSTALIPALAGLAGLATLSGPAFAAGFARAMWIGAGLTAAGGAVAYGTIRACADLPSTPHPSPGHGCTFRRPLRLDTTG